MRRRALSELVYHLIRVIALTTFLGLCMLLPFLPGRYDALANPLSMMTQLVGIVGLLLVPVGTVWMLYEWISAQKRKRYAFGIIALVSLSIVWSIVSLGAMFESVALGAASLTLLAVLMPRLWRLVRASSVVPEPDRRSASPMPLYLVIVPAAVAVMRVAFADPAAEFSRDRAIRNAAPLIADIERHRVANGRYPMSIVSVHPDYLPGIIGIERYGYEPSGAAYNLFFEQLSLRIGIKEIVMYNPHGEQSISSHAADVLQLTPAELALDRRRGHNEVREARQAKWKYFWFD